MVGKSFISIKGLRLAASAASPVVSTAEVRRKLRRPIAFAGGGRSGDDVAPALCADGSLARGAGWLAGDGGGMSISIPGGLRTGPGADVPQGMRAGRGLARRKRGRMRVMAVHAVLSLVPRQFQRISVLEKQAVEADQVGVLLVLLHQAGRFRRQRDPFESLRLVNGRFSNYCVQSLHDNILNGL